MAIIINTVINSLYIGNTTIIKVYVGDNLVFNV